MAERTETGLIKLEPGEPISAEGFALQAENPEITNRLLQIGTTTHRHDGSARMGDPVAPLVVQVLADGGHISSGLELHVGYTQLDQYGSETALSPTVMVDTGEGLGDITIAPTLAVAHDSGALLADVYRYAVTAIDGSGGQTALGPVAEVEVPSGFANSRVTISGLQSIVDEVGGVGWAVYRQVGGGAWVRAAQGIADELVDDGTLCVDCGAPPSGPTDTSNAVKRLSVQLPASTTDLRLYISLDGSFSSPCYVGQYDGGELVVLDTLELLDGSPPPVSTTVAGAAQINPETDIANFTWRAPVATHALLPTEGNRNGDVRVVVEDFSLNTWVESANSWTGIGGGGGGVSAWRPPVMAVGDLPTVGNSHGDVRLVLEDFTLHGWSEDYDQWYAVSGGGGGGGPVPPAGDVAWQAPVAMAAELDNIDGGDNYALRYVAAANRIYAWEPWESNWSPLNDTVGGGGGASGITPVATRSDLDAIEAPALGDMYLVQDENAIYVWDEYFEGKASVTDWRMLNALSTAELQLGDDLHWWVSKPLFDSAGSWLIRSQNSVVEKDMSVDPGLVTEGYSGLAYIAAGATTPAGYGPAPWNDNWDLYHVRRETREVLAKKSWNVYVEGVLVDLPVFNGIHYVAATLGRPGFEGFSTLYGLIDTLNGQLRFARVSGENQDMSYTGLESVDMGGVPPAGSTFWIEMDRTGNTITLTAAIQPPDDVDGTLYYEATVTHTVALDGSDGWMEPQEGLYPGFGSQFGDNPNDHLFTYAQFMAYDTKRELVLKLKPPGSSSATQQFVVADTIDGWLMRDQDVADLPGTDDGPHVIQKNDGTNLAQRPALRAAGGDAYVNIEASDDGGSNSTHLRVTFNEGPLEEKAKEVTLTQTGGKGTEFVPIGLESGFSQPVIEENEATPGTRYPCSVMLAPTGMAIFRGFFVAAGAGAGFVGTVPDGFAPPHPARGVGVREDGVVMPVLVEANGQISTYGHQQGNNHLDGVSYFSGRAPVALRSDGFDPDPADPYRAAHTSVGDGSGGKIHTTNITGSGIFKANRVGNQGRAYVFPPDIEGGYWDIYDVDNASYATYKVLEGPNVGQTGNATVERDLSASGLVFIVTVPDGWENVKVQVTMHVVFRWYEGFPS